MIDVIQEAARDLLVAEYEWHRDLHEWVGPGDNRPFRFELSCWHRGVGQESWRLAVRRTGSFQFLFDDAAAAYAGPQFSIQVDIGDSLFPRKAMEWLRSLRAEALRVAA